MNGPHDPPRTMGCLNGDAIAMILAVILLGIGKVLGLEL